MIFLGYLLVFGVSGLACWAGAYRTRQIPDPDTRRGLMALLLLSGLWALAQFGYLVVHASAAKITLYLIGLIAGFATVWAWLYFCFAYTDRTLHRHPTIQRMALGLFAGIVLVKLTNPLHHFYFSTEWAAAPFVHLAIQNHVLHWVTFGLAYALSAIGIFVMVKFFVTIASDTRPLFILLGLTTLPALFNAAGHADIYYVLDVGYEPIGVAAFAIGILFVYADEFHDIHLTGNREAPALVLDRDDRIRTYNAEAAALFPALRNGQGTGKQLSEVAPTLAAAYDTSPPLLKTDVGNTQKWFLVCRSGLGTTHQRPGQMLLLNDITKQKEREQALRAAKEKAEEVSRLKSAILANMKHEVRTPLTSVLSFAGILKQNVSEQDERYVDLIIRGGERLRDTFDSVIRLSELETGAVELEPEPINLCHVADTTVQLLRPQAEENGLDLRTQFPKDPVRGEWDENALFHIAENLLENAIKFTSEGGSVIVRVRDNGAESVLEVEDTGIGISDEDRSYIFDAFRQVEDGPKRQYDGSGLGLSIVKKLVEAHGGDIDLESVPGEGSCFVVRLPKSTDSGNAKERASA